MRPTLSPPPPFDRHRVTFRVDQIQQHLGIEEDDGDGKAESIQDEVYEVDTNMTPEQVRLCYVHLRMYTTLWSRSRRPWQYFDCVHP